MAKRAKFSGNQCFLCGRQCAPATDNEGQSYMGCPVCRFVSAAPDAKPSRADKLAAQLSQAQAEITALRLQVESRDNTIGQLLATLSDTEERLPGITGARAAVEKGTT